MAAKSGTAKVDRAKVVKVSLPSAIFDVATNVPLIHQVVVAQQNAARQGTHSTKTRGEVRGGGRKPFKQKGTGRARQGSTRAPQFVGGGTVHGPKPRDYSQRTPKKMKAAALRGALSDRARAGRIHVVESLVGGEKPSTRTAVARLNSVVGGQRQLVVLERDDALTWLSLRNVPSVHLIAVDQLNTYDVLLSDDVVFTKGAYDLFVGVPDAGAHGQGYDGTPDKSVAPQTKGTELLDKAQSTSTTHQGRTLEEAFEAAMNVDNVKTYRGDDPDIDGWSVSSDSVEYVAIERHTDHVLATWPTTMSAREAIRFFQTITPTAVYADGGDNDYLEYDDEGPTADWKAISSLAAKLHFLRVDVGDRVLIWEEPDEGLTDHRFLLIEPKVVTSQLRSLIESTTTRDVLGLLEQFVDVGKLDLEPLKETG